MKKKKFNKKLSAQKQNTKTVKKKAESSSRLPIVNNLVIGFIFFGIIFYAKNNNPGYKWLNETLIGKNLETIKKNKNLTHEQKLEAKLGMNLRYLNFVNANTPENAVILMPPDEIIMSENALKSGLSKDLKNKTWTSYFLYPRKVVYEREKESSSLYPNASRVAIINNWGYDKLEYQTNQKAGLSVLPIKKQEVK